MEELSIRRRIALVIYAFTAAAVGGWLYEECCVYFMYGYLYKRGMLHLTLCPIYGFGAWGLYLLLRKVKSTPLFFLLSVIIASAFEYACSYLLEMIFHRSFWTYSDWAFSVNDRISLISSCIFGLLAVFFAKCLLPLLTKLVRRGKAQLHLGIALGILAVIAGDFLLVLRSY